MSFALSDLGWNNVTLTNQMTSFTSETGSVVNVEIIECFDMIMRYYPLSPRFKLICEPFFVGILKLFWIAPPAHSPTLIQPLKILTIYLRVQCPNWYLMECPSQVCQPIFESNIHESPMFLSLLLFS